MVVLSVQIQTENQVSIVISGSTWGYRHKFQSKGISGGYANPDSEDKGPYVRTLRDLDISQADERQRVFNMLGEEIFNQLAMKVQVDSSAGGHESDAVSNFIQELKQYQHLHFHETPVNEAGA